MTTKKQATLDQQETARRELRKMLPPGSVVDVIQRKVSASGMTRWLSLRAKDRDITYAAAEAMGERVDQSTGYFAIKVGGCGMDMHFATVYNLSRALYPEGHRCTGQGGTKEDRHGRRLYCPSNDHSNDYGTASRAWEADNPAPAEAIRAVLYGHNATDSQREAVRRFTAARKLRDAYIDNRLATDLGYNRKRVHRDGGYALTHRTI